MLRTTARLEKGRKLSEAGAKARLYREMIEARLGRIIEVLGQTRFKSEAELEATLTSYAEAYNHRIPQRALGHRTPIQELQKRRAEKPDLFSRRVSDLPGLDTPVRHRDR